MLKPIHSAVSTLFIVNATSTGSVSDKNYAAGTDPADKVLADFDCDNDNVTIHIEVDAGPNANVASGWQPTVTIYGPNGESHEVSNLAQIDGSRRFTGSATFSSASANGTFYAMSIDGGRSQDVDYERLLDPPLIISVAWDNQGMNPDPYPAMQTQFKNGDLMQVSGTCEAHADEVYIKDAGAASGRGLQGPYAATAGAWTAANVYAGNANDATAHLICYAKVTEGTAGPDFNSETDQTPATVVCDQTPPTFGSPSVQYPGSQEAIKDSETVDITLMHTNPIWGDAYLYTNNGTGELSIPNVTTYAQTKTGVQRIAGDYRESGNNYKLTVTRAKMNGKSASAYAYVRIAHTFPTITVDRYSSMDGLNKRLRTDDGTNNHYDHQIRLKADQARLSTDTPEIQGPPVGTFQGSWTQQSTTEYRRNLRMADGDIVQGGQGANTCAWNDSTTVSWVNRAGKETTTVTTGNSFTVGGFDARTLTIPAWPNREADCAVYAVDTSKLESENLSKGGEGPNGGTIFTFDNSPGEGNTPDDETNKFCMSNGSDIVDDDGQYWYNKDLPNAMSNTSGTARVIVEEAA